MFLTRLLLATLSLAASIIALPLQLSHEHAELISTTLETRDAHRAFVLENIVEAGQLNTKFAGLSPSSSCVNDEKACVNDQLADCVGQQFVLTQCDVGVCSAVPLPDARGVNITCSPEPLARNGLTMASISTPRVASASLSKRESPQAPPACPAKWKDLNPVPQNFVHSGLPDGMYEWRTACKNFEFKKMQECRDKLRGLDNSLMINVDPCSQQDNAVNLINYAKSHGESHKDGLIAAALDYARFVLPSDFTPSIPYSVPYCQKDPKVEELKGIFHTQMPDANPGLFRDRNGKVVAFGEEGTCPFGKKADLATCTCK